MIRHCICILLMFISVSYSNAQKQVLSGVILNEENNQPIAYAHLIIPSKKKGTTADKEGMFRFSFPDDWIGEKLKITCVGFQDQWITIKGTNTLKVLMKPSVESLHVVHLSNANEQERVKINSFKGKRTVGLGNFSGGAYPSMFARYYPYNVSLGDENFLKEVKIYFFQKKRHKAKFRLRILASDANKYPKQDIWESKIIRISKNQGRVKVVMTEGIEIPKEGFFVVVEHLFVEENAFNEYISLKVNDTLHVKKIKQKRYAPIFKGIIEKETESHSYYMSINGWKKVKKLKMPLSNFEKNEVVAPAFKLKITN